MKTEKDKMLAGELYNSLDKELSDDRLKARLLTRQLNNTGEDQPDERKRILKELMPAAAADLLLQPPFYCDYGSNIKTGEKVFFNFNCVVLDVAQVTIGSRTLLGPNVQITQQHTPWIIMKEFQALNMPNQYQLERMYGLAEALLFAPG